MALNKRGFFASGQTILVAGAASAPVGVQASNYNSAAMDTGIQARIHNSGPNLAFVAYATTANGAQTAAVIPIGGTPASVLPIPPGAIEVVTAGQNMFWSAICAGVGTASVYITPGDGV